MTQFKHDCPACTFLGSIVDRNERLCDLYVCVDDHDPDGTSFIARYSDEGSDYISTSLIMVGRKLPDPLAIAFTLAEGRGLLS